MFIIMKEHITQCSTDVFLIVFCTTLELQDTEKEAKCTDLFSLCIIECERYDANSLYTTTHLQSTGWKCHCCICPCPWTHCRPRTILLLCCLFSSSRQLHKQADATTATIRLPWIKGQCLPMSKISPSTDEPCHFAAVHSKEVNGSHLRPRSCEAGCIYMAWKWYHMLFLSISEVRFMCSPAAKALQEQRGGYAVEKNPSVHIIRCCWHHLCANLSPQWCYLKLLCYWKYVCILVFTNTQVLALRPDVCVFLKIMKSFVISQPRASSADKLLLRTELWILPLQGAGWLWAGFSRPFPWVPRLLPSQSDSLTHISSRTSTNIHTLKKAHMSNASAQTLLDFTSNLSLWLACAKATCKCTHTHTDPKMSSTNQTDTHKHSWIHQLCRLWF